MRNVSLNFRTEMFRQESGETPVLLLTITHPDLDQPVRLSTDPTQRLSADPLALVRHRIGLRLAEYARACTRNQAGTRPGDAGTVRPVAQP